jgi:hypothetical protein
MQGLRSSLGPIVAMLPMPMTEASIESVESTPTGYKVVLHLVGEGDTLRLETRWKDRDCQPTIVEASGCMRRKSRQPLKRKGQRTRFAKADARGVAPTTPSSVSPGQLARQAREQAP